MTVRRIKTYTGGQGYVYQYYFVGSRTALAGSGQPASQEYIFDVTADRKTTFAVSVFLREEAVRAWTSSHGRTLTEAERYGAVKMRLFQAFDELENVREEGRELVLDAPSLSAALQTLGVE